MKNSLQYEDVLIRYYPTVTSGQKIMNLILVKNIKRKYKDGEYYEIVSPPSLKGKTLLPQFCFEESLKYLAIQELDRLIKHTITTKLADCQTIDDFQNLKKFSSSPIVFLDGSK